MITESPLRFEFSGRFAGFFRDIFGKRRMVLLVEGEELYLKIPKALRHELEGKLRPGQVIGVAGCEDHLAGKNTHIVTQVVTSGDAACFTCPIQVCAKKHCWRNGGRELYRELESRIESAGLGGTVRLQAVNCLDDCKHGPNVEVAGRDFHRCTPGDAGSILQQIAGPGDFRERKDSVWNPDDER